jgi:hypothetical protein
VRHVQSDPAIADQGGLLHQDDVLGAAAHLEQVGAARLSGGDGVEADVELETIQ